DQVGNRAAGDRIHHGLSPGAHAAASALILLGPGTPMLFQGEEWAASTPFTYFTAHDDELGAAVTAGRVEEFSAMGWPSRSPIRSCARPSRPRSCAGRSASRPGTRRCWSGTAR